MRYFIAHVFVLTACVTANPQAQHVRVTNNPDVVRACAFLGNVTAMSGWGGGQAGKNNVEETMKERTHALGGNVVYVVENSGSRGTGEAYRCTTNTP